MGASKLKSGTANTTDLYLKFGVKMKKSIVPVLILFVSIFITSCEKIDNQKLRVDNITYGTCKPGLKSLVANEKIEYRTVDINYLEVNHINAMFNCEPGRLLVDVEFNNDTIFVNESEEQSLVNCICPYDLSYRIGPLEYGTYQFVLKIMSFEHATFELEFNSTTEGIFEFKNK